MPSAVLGTRVAPSPGDAGWARGRRPAAPGPAALLSGCCQSPGGAPAMRGPAAPKCLRGKGNSGADGRTRTADLLIPNWFRGIPPRSADVRKRMQTRRLAPSRTPATSANVQARSPPLLHRCCQTGPAGLASSCSGRDHPGIPLAQRPEILNDYRPDQVLGRHRVPQAPSSQSKGSALRRYRLVRPQSGPGFLRRILTGGTSIRLSRRADTIACSCGLGPSSSSTSFTVVSVSVTGLTGGWRSKLGA